jgi:hypothetical protein
MGSNCEHIENIIYVNDLLGIEMVRLGQFDLRLNGTDEFLLCRLAKYHRRRGQRVCFHGIPLKSLLKGI